MDANKNGIIDMKITAKKSSSRIPHYFIDGEFITFTGNLEEDDYELVYHCLK